MTDDLVIFFLYVLLLIYASDWWFLLTLILTFFYFSIYSLKILRKVNNDIELSKYELGIYFVIKKLLNLRDFIVKVVKVIFSSILSVFYFLIILGIWWYLLGGLLGILKFGWSQW
jgi:hypothetical protein